MSKTPDTADTVQRLQQRPRQVSSAKSLGLATLTLLGLVFLVGQARRGTQSTVHEEVVARQFRLVDDNGVTIAKLATGEDGSGLFLMDARGTKRATLTFTDDGPRLFLTDRAGNERAVIAVTDDAPSLVLSDDKAISRAALFLNDDASANLILLDKNESGRASLVLNNDGEPTFSLRDGAGNTLYRQP